MIKNANKFIFFSIALFFLSSIAGVILSRVNPSASQALVESLTKDIQPLLEESPPVLAAYIFFNNTAIDFAAIITFFFFGLVPLYFILSNGFIIGLVVSEAAKKATITQIVLTLMPHGIFELPAFFIAMGYGLWLGIQFFKKVFLKKPFKQPFLESIKVFVYVIIILNIVAALIEVYVTPLIYSGLK